MGLASVWFIGECYVTQAAGPGLCLRIFHCYILLSNTTDIYCYNPIELLSDTTLNMSLLISTLSTLSSEEPFNSIEST